jgi:hypothetical protein
MINNNSGHEHNEIDKRVKVQFVFKRKKRKTQETRK